MISIFTSGTNWGCAGDRRLQRAFAVSIILMTSGLGLSAQPAGSADSGEVLQLYPGAAPGSTGAKQKEVEVSARIYNVTTPTLTVFRPKAGSATDAAVIIAPGGGFVRLAIQGEGYKVAKYLADHGITAIVLKYRTDETPADRVPAPGSIIGADGAPPPSRSPRAAVADPRPPNNSLGAHQAVADGFAAVRFVRAHADEWKISPQRVGFVGFSAGSFIAMELARSADATSRPNFVAAIYSPRPAEMVVPADAPPLFLAVAADDEAVGNVASLDIFQAWRAAGRSVELHVFESGKHGFNMAHQQKTSDHWIDEYLWWLRASNGAVKLPE